MKAGATGADWSTARPTDAQILANNIEFACRYVLDAARSRGKRLTRAEALGLSALGVELVANFEYAAGGALGGYDQGRADALVALAELAALGAPRRVVYFSADVDLSIGQIPLVLDYAAGAASALGKAGVGLYGEYDLIEAAHKAGYRWLWQTYAWSRGLWSQWATIRQTKNGAFPGQFDGDRDVAMADDIGQWTLGVSMANTTVPDALVPYFPAELGIKKGWTITEAELAWQSMLRGAQAASAAGKALGMVTALAAAVAKVQGVDAETLAAVQEASAEVKALMDAIHTMPGVDPAAQAAAALDALRARLES